MGPNPYKMKKGTYVSRSVYQHVKEENKKLLQDLRVISTGNPVKAFLLRLKWRKKFKHNGYMDEVITDLSKKLLL
jgi:hypothetical protein